MRFKSNFFHDISNFEYLWHLTRTFNYTALIWAACRGHTEIVEHLLSQRGIDINIQNI